MRSKTFTALLSWAVLLVGRSAPAADELAFATNDGRVLVGQLDERTDERTAWVRIDTGDIRLTTAVPWAAVVSVEEHGQAMDVEQLWVRRDEYVTAASAFDFAGDTETRQWVEPRRRPQVTSLTVLYAELTNLDRDPAPDGLVVSFAALDAAGMPIPVRGSLYGRLWTERRPWRDPGLGDFAAEETWSRAIAVDDFVDGVATVTLPFRNIEPQQQFDLLPDAELVLRLTAYGSGNFEASAPVCVRPYDRYRDRLQHAEGTRYVPRELPGSRVRGNFSRTDGRWIGWP